MRPTLFALALCAFIAACSHGGDVPLDVNFCVTDTHVHPCEGYPMRGTAHNTLPGPTVCATCDDANYTLTCQVDTGSAYDFAVCVADCSACVGGRPTGSDPRVHLCEPGRYRESSWCATCDDLNLSLATELCDKDGFCNPIVCVADCATCALEP